MKIFISIKRFAGLITLTFISLAQLGAMSTDLVRVQKPSTEGRASSSTRGRALEQPASTPATTRRRSLSRTEAREFVGLARGFMDSGIKDPKVKEFVAAGFSLGELTGLLDARTYSEVDSAVKLSARYVHPDKNPDDTEAATLAMNVLAKAGRLAKRRLSIADAPAASVAAHAPATVDLPAIADNASFWTTQNIQLVCSIGVASIGVLYALWSMTS